MFTYAILTRVLQAIEVRRMGLKSNHVYWSSEQWPVIFHFLNLLLHHRGKDETPVAKTYLLTIDESQGT